MGAQRARPRLAAVALTLAALLALPANGLAVSPPDPVLLIHGWRADASA